MQAEQLGKGLKPIRRLWGTRVKKFGERWMVSVLEVETHHTDYLLVTFGNYDSAKIAWANMNEDTRQSRESLHTQLTRLSQVIATRLTPQATLWLATDWGPHSRITASGPNNRAPASSIGN